MQDDKTKPLEQGGPSGNQSVQSTQQGATSNNNQSEQTNQQGPVNPLRGGALHDGLNTKGGNIPITKK